MIRIISPTFLVLATLIALSGCAKEPAPPHPQPPVVQVVIQPTPENAKEDDKAKKKNIKTATEKQMDFLKVLAKRKGWKETEFDKQTELTLGYRRKFAEVNKTEASTMIDAWK